MNKSTRDNERLRWYRFFDQPVSDIGMDCSTLLNYRPRGL